LFSYRLSPETFGYTLVCLLFENAQTYKICIFSENYEHADGAV